MAKELNYYQKALNQATTYGPSLPQSGSFTQRGDGSTAWDKFLTAVNNYGLKRENFSDWDWEAAQADPEWGVGLATIKRDWNNAATDEQRALLNARANQHRNLKGYTADAAGLGYYQVENTPKQDTFNYQNETMYQKALNDLLNRKEFSWSKEEDPQWASLKKSYLREGERATANALAQASAATGGRPSTAAVAAATQAGDYYATQLNDMIPTLYQNAYNRYLQEYQQKLSDLSAMGEDRAQKYQAWLTETERQREDDAAAKALAQEQVKAILEAGGSPDDALLGQSGYGSPYRDALKNYVAKQNAIEEAARDRETADWYAGYGDLSKIGEAGVDTAYQQALLDAQLQNLLKSGRAGGTVLTAQTTETPAAETAQGTEYETVDLSGVPPYYLLQLLKSQGATQEELAEVVEEYRRQGLMNAGQARALKKGTISEY